MQTRRLKIVASIGFAMTAIVAMAAIRSAAVPNSSIFGNPKPVTILGYSGDAMEPDISRDGMYLFFNNLNAPSVNTNIYYAKRIDNNTFKFAGEVGGVNTPELEGTPSIDNAQNFYFVSPRSYRTTLSTVYSGKFSNGSVSGVAIVRGISRHVPGIVDMDAAISADGRTLYLSEAQFENQALKASKIVIATRSSTGFHIDPKSDKTLARVNTARLDYAADISADGLTLLFTRALSWPQLQPAICVAKRNTISEPFGEPARLGALTGFVEAPSVTSDGRLLYYHKKVDGHFVVFCADRNRS